MEPIDHNWKGALRDLLMALTELVKVATKALRDSEKNKSGDSAPPIR